MEIRHLSISGCWVYTPKIYKDQRGQFFEWFQNSTFSSLVGEEFNIAQANCSISNAGVVRGIHFTRKSPGQSKLVTVFKGKVFDVVVDLRKSSKTFGKWESILLDAENPQTLYIPWGVGHGFMALENDTVFVYLCDSKYNPENEFDLNAFDPDLGIEWPADYKFIQSQKDSEASSLKSIHSLLPD